MVIANCNVCGKEFNKRASQKTCEDHRGLVKKECKSCSSEIIVHRQISYCETCRKGDRTCKNCNKTFTPINTNAKIQQFCSDYCSHRWRDINIYNPPKGYNQKGESNNNWKDGRSMEYAIRIAREAHGDACQRCGSEENTLVHHKDRNRQHNVVENLEVLCKRCHQIEHQCWISFKGIKGIPR